MLAAINDGVKSGINSKYYSAVKKLINNLDIEVADSYMRLKISIITKQIATTRERIYEIRESIDKQRNSDEIRHLEYDLQEEMGALNNLLEELQDAYDLYEFYKLQNLIKNIKMFLSVEGSIT